MEPGFCISCQFFEVFEATGYSFARNVFDALAESSLNLLPAAFFLYGVFVIYRVMTNQQVDFHDVIRTVLAFIFVTCILLGNSLWWDFYEILFDTALGLGVRIMEVGGIQPQGSGLYAYLYAAETPAVSVAAPSFGIFKSNGGELVRFVASLVMVVVFLWLWWGFARGVLSGMLKFVGVAIVSPIVLVAAVFPLTRKMFFNAIKWMLLGFFELVMQGAVIALCSFVLTGIGNQIPAGAYGGSVDLNETGGFLLGDHYLLLLLTGIALIFVQAEFSKLGTQLADAVDRQASRAAGLGDIAQAAGQITTAARGLAPALAKLNPTLAAVSTALQQAARGLKK